MRGEVRMLEGCRAVARRRRLGEAADVGAAARGAACGAAHEVHPEEDVARVEGVGLAVGADDAEAEGGQRQAPG